MDDSTRKERARCVEIVDLAIAESGDDGQWLYRVRNLIANGRKPVTVREQVEGGLRELRRRRKKPGAK